MKFKGIIGKSWEGNFARAKLGDTLGGTMNLYIAYG